MTEVNEDSIVAKIEKLLSAISLEVQKEFTRVRDKAEHNCKNIHELITLLAKFEERMHSMKVDVEKLEKELSKKASKEDVTGLKKINSWLTSLIIGAVVIALVKQVLVK